MFLKKMLISLVAILILIFLLIGIYVAYMQITYYRIPDNTELEIENNNSNIIKIGQNYSAMTYNLGYGAYSQNFSFFMDSAYIKETGEFIKGKYGKAISKDDVLNNTNNAIKIMKDNPVDLYLLQEVDEDSYRSYKVNQRFMVKDSFKDYANTFANNFHAKFLAYPIPDMHGYVNSGLFSLSNLKIKSSLRKSYPITKAFIDKFVDLDRCFNVIRLEVEGNKELVLINTHMSAYDEGGVIRKAQLELLNSFLEEEYKKNNYIIVGGDFNHDYCNSKELYMGNKTVPKSLYQLNDDDLPKGYNFVIPQNKEVAGSCRGADSPYNKETSYQSIIDGFIVSNNILAKSKVINTDFIASDHQPVILEFSLK